MKIEYDIMMRWALGDDYLHHNIKDSPEIWKLHHPEFGDLKRLEGKTALLNASFFVFQMTLAWVAAHGYQCVFAQPSEKTPKQKESHNDKDSSSTFRAMFSNLMSLFKSKSQS